ncbi:hypothetical protein FLJC2902T_10890 [Flavobacterium limnosediminis JC2902]|uniref:Uncharacterized protein n=1 Tax=Flavobacterium limnosediminis JC2902 TaxID=1341181 RepID=V6SS90_9FLAO|nr:outer membrane beta-barrel protein [Flavobacterium limnosediminis]ESU29052.1 hypothetical protein FLJC2902T_10890 [Flavobacterium limnosediminis JC2902]
MKKNLLTLTLLLCSFALFAQSTTTTSENPTNKFEVLVIAKLGSGIIQETGSAPTNGNINGGDFLLSMKLGKAFNLATGLGYYEFYGNRTLDGNTASIKNAYLRFPLIAHGNVSIYKNKPENQRIFLTAGLGFYGNHQFKQETETIAGNYSDSNLGWNLGFSTQLGVKFEVTDVLNLGIGYEVQSDLTDMKKDGVDRKMASMNTLNFTLGFKL